MMFLEQHGLQVGPNGIDPTVNDGQLFVVSQTAGIGLANVPHSCGTHLLQCGINGGWILKKGRVLGISQSQEGIRDACQHAVPLCLILSKEQGVAKFTKSMTPHGSLSGSIGRSHNDHQARPLALFNLQKVIQVHMTRRHG
eukprot:scaffold161203_cov51-Attheya_sp.AAC.2